MAYWAIKVWEDVGGPEDGIIIHEGYSVYEADTAQEAELLAIAAGEKVGSDIRPATENEIAEYQYIQEQEEEYKRLYGCYPWEHTPEEEDPTQGDEIRTPWGGLVD